MAEPTTKKPTQEEIEEEIEQPQSLGCGILGRYPVLSVLLFGVSCYDCY